MLWDVFLGIFGLSGVVGFRSVDVFDLFGVFFKGLKRCFLSLVLSFGGHKLWISFYVFLGVQETCGVFGGVSKDFFGS